MQLPIPGIFPGILLKLYKGRPENRQECSTGAISTKDFDSHLGAQWVFCSHRILSSDEYLWDLVLVAQKVIVPTSNQYLSEGPPSAGVRRPAKIPETTGPYLLQIHTGEESTKRRCLESRLVQNPGSGC